MRTGQLDAVLCPPESLYMEVDTPEEYGRLQRDVAPRLAELQAALSHPLES